MLKSFTTATFLGLGYFFSPTTQAGAEESKADSTRHAVCILSPETESMTHGIVAFTQESITAPCQIAGHIKNMKANSVSGLFVTEYGDYILGKKTLGPVYSPRPLLKSEDRPPERTKIGDVGHVKADHRGIGYVAIKNSDINLFGKESIMGRGIALNDGEKEDAELLASGVIGFSSSFKTISPQ